MYPFRFRTPQSRWWLKFERIECDGFIPRPLFQPTIQIYDEMINKTCPLLAITCPWALTSWPWAFNPGWYLYLWKDEVKGNSILKSSWKSEPFQPIPTPCLTCSSFLSDLFFFLTCFLFCVASRCLYLTFFHLTFLLANRYLMGGMSWGTASGLPKTYNQADLEKIS